MEMSGWGSVRWRYKIDATCDSESFHRYPEFWINCTILNMDHRLFIASAVGIVCIGIGTWWGAKEVYSLRLRFVGHGKFGSFMANLLIAYGGLTSTQSTWWCRSRTYLSLSSAHIDGFQQRKSNKSLSISKFWLLTPFTRSSGVEWEQDVLGIRQCLCNFFCLNYICPQGPGTDAVYIVSPDALHQQQALSSIK